MYHFGMQAMLSSALISGTFFHENLVLKTFCVHSSLSFHSLVFSLIFCRTDTFADMYDSDEIVARNPESLSNIEAHHNPIKKVKHRTRQKTFIDSEKFLSSDRFKNTRRSAETNSDGSSRQRLESNRDRYSKRRHLETNDDMFNIRSSRDSLGDRNGVFEIHHSENISIDNVSDIPVHHTDRGATADIGNTVNVDKDFDRSLNISVKEMDYR